ncbi:hypothetical protein DKM44_06275 [Deinococcus irradiatisoli]|uniref:DUF4900 domain-containing protein n=1 Tax=Deinococcus irradiatisoli TaxID=2202254 RepID=A0A2Z3JCK1_9DEIO|nr:DUF4900 domain-containing protein [Deinococcus irradiatisoli]AWN22883.1 hypothetical protein DKM44_06275 [Deinococcus irradiatisoli]
MKIHGHLTPQRREEGATLVVLVLLLMVILGGVIVVSANLALSARRTTSDQRTSLQAQYAAETGANQAKAKLSLFNNLIDNVQPLSSVSRADVLSKFANICGAQASAAMNVVPLPDATTQVSLSGNALSSPGTALCDLTATPVSASAVSTLLASYIDSSVLSSFGLDSTKLSTFTTDLIKSASLQNDRLLPTATTSGNLTSNFGIVPISVTRSGLDSFSMQFLVSDLKATATSATGTRAVSASARQFSDRKIYSLNVYKSSFARYALFTNHHFSSSSDEGSANNIWFTSNTKFSGPVHTNQTFNFLDTPYFGGQITSAGCSRNGITAGSGTNPDSCTGTVNPGARFYSSPNSITPPSGMGGDPQNPNVGGNAPSLNGSPTHVNWNKEFVPLPNNAQDQKAASNDVIAVNGVNQTGLLINSSVTKMSFGVSMVGGIKYQLLSYTKGNGTAVSLRYDENGTMQILSSGSWVPAYKNVTSGEWQSGNSGAVSAKFNGVIYADGPVSSVYTEPGSLNSKAVASFGQLTLSATNNIVISDNLLYEDPPCTGTSATAPSCDTVADDGTMKKNVLGIYSGTGNIEIANNGTNSTQNTNPGTCTTTSGRATCTSVVNAPNNVTIHAVLMASRGAVQVQNYSSNISRGVVNLLGGVIENYYGAFGQTNGNGFGRNYIYDTRMEVGFTPPSFPTQQNWTVDSSSWTQNVTAPSTVSTIPLTGNVIQEAP